MTTAQGQAPVSTPGSDVLEDVRVEQGTGTGDAWATVVWNDPVNLMNYVSYVFQSYFGYGADKARLLMLQVHEEGRAIVSSGGREKVEVDVQAMHGFGLWATMQRGSDA